MLKRGRFFLHSVRALRMCLGGRQKPEQGCGGRATCPAVGALKLLHIVTLDMCEFTISYLPLYFTVDNVMLGTVAAIL